MKKIVCLAVSILLCIFAVGCGSDYDEPHRHLYMTNKTQPTCSSKGYTRYECTKCGYVVISDYVNALSTGGHVYDDCVCLECGDFLADEATVNEGFTFAEETDESGNAVYAVTGICSKECRYLKIPTEYEGIPVTKIADKAFYNLLNLQHVILPEGIVSIGEEAFRYCTRLKSVAIPETVKSIGSGAFWDCQRLEIISLKHVTQIGECAFLDCFQLMSVELAEGVKYVDAGAFDDCRNLINVLIPNSVRSIYIGAFKNCANLQNIYYHGTKAQWDAIYKYSDWGGENAWDADTGNYTVYCLDGELKKGERA